MFGGDTLHPGNRIRHGREVHSLILPNPLARVQPKFLHSYQILRTLAREIHSAQQKIPSSPKKITV